MEEIKDIKIIHQIIQELRPEWKIIESGIRGDLSNVAFSEFVVRNNEKEIYIINFLEEINNMYGSYLESTKELREGIEEIKVTIKNIERLKSILEEKMEERKKKTKDPRFMELVVIENPKERYFLRITENLFKMYDGYIDVINTIILGKPERGKEIIKKLEEDFDEEDLNEGIIAESKSLDSSKRTISKKGRRLKEGNNNNN